MKIVALVILLAGYALGRGSGPYLPSGWRPQGPAFLLPTEAEESPAIPLKDAPLQETEASGSEFLREYGPPKVSQDISQQALPDVVTEQSFITIDARFNKQDTKEVVNEGALEEVSNQIIAKENEGATTDSQNTAEEPITEAIYVPVIRGKAIVEPERIEETTSTASQQETTESDTGSTKTENTNSNIIATSEENAQGITEEVDNTSEGIKNIADALLDLENEVKAEQVQTIRKITEINTAEGSGTSQPVPEGFLEYGPPGFREYGPPKQDELSRSSLVSEVQLSDEENIESNDTRRRRFSPKFKPLHKKKH